MIEIVTLIVGLIIGIVLAYIFLRARVSAQLSKWKTEFREEFEDKTRREALERSRAALKGRVGEQLAPLLPMFEYEPSDARFIGSPVDYVIFEGHSKEKPKGITFADIKTGKTARLTKRQKGFKKAIENGKVKWETIHVGALEEE